MQVPHPVPYQGSKRLLAAAILRCLPDSVETLYEPFAGSAALTLAAAQRGIGKRFKLNDLNRPLMNLWRAIIETPHELATAYSILWHAQQGREKDYYDYVRTQFNLTQRADYLLYLLARCVKAAVRYNSQGEFNQSPDNRRQGTQPTTMQHNILAASRLLQGRTQCFTGDYSVVLEQVTRRDVVYFDPPYQGVSGRRDPRYFQQVQLDDFAARLDELNTRNISYLVSYDGRTGNKSFGASLPEFLRLTRLELPARRSSQATLLGRCEHTFESLYLSPALVKQLPSLALQHAIERQQGALLW